MNYFCRYSLSNFARNERCIHFQGTMWV